MNTSCGRPAAALILTLTLAFVPALADAEPPTVTVLGSQPASTLSVTTFDGKPFNLAAQRGKWVLVYFWASWCAPCTNGLPVLSKFLAAHNDVAAIGLDVMEQDGGQLDRFLSSHHFDLPIATVGLTEEARFAVALPGLSPLAKAPIPAIPLTWVIAPDGTARQTWMGEFNAAQLAHLTRKAGYRATPKS